LTVLLYFGGNRTLHAKYAHGDRAVGLFV